MSTRDSMLTDYVCPDCAIDLTSSATCFCCGENFLDEISVIPQPTEGTP